VFMVTAYWRSHCSPVLTCSCWSSLSGVEAIG
jgi:hypothetical protein